MLEGFQGLPNECCSVFDDKLLIQGQNTGRKSHTNGTYVICKYKFEGNVDIYYQKYVANHCW